MTQLQYLCLVELEILINGVFSLLALLSQEREAQHGTEPQSSGPSENEVALQEALNALQQEKDAITSQYQAQVCFTLFSPNPF